MSCIQAISLQEAFFVHQKVKQHFSRPRTLTEYGPTYGGGQAPTIQIDSITGQIRVVRPKPTLQEILQKARQKLRRPKADSTVEDAAPSFFNRFNNAKPNLT